MPYRAIAGAVLILGCLAFGPLVHAQYGPEPRANAEDEAIPQRARSGHAENPERETNRVPPQVPSEQAPSERNATAERDDETRDRKSDLAAQWMAAHAADDAIFWIQLQTYIAGGGAVLVFIALIFSAVGIGTAVEANKINRETAQRQLRAYLMPEQAKITVVPGVEAPPTAYVAICIQNGGQTPAHNVRCGLRFASMPIGEEDFSMHDLSWSGWGVFNPGIKRWPHIEVGGPEFERQMEAIFEDRERLYFFGIVKYDDVFGRPWESFFRYRLPFQERHVVGGNLIACQEGNEAT